MRIKLVKIFMNFTVEWLDNLAQNVIKIPLNTNSKGMMGKVCIIGGSENYTGAPFFSAIASMRMGSDLAYVMCPPCSAIPIKCHSPDIIVLPILNEYFLESFEKFHHQMNSFVIGPGLGKIPILVPIISDVIKIISHSKKPCVIDADGLWYVSQNPENFAHLGNCVLTPNIVELKRLGIILGINDVTSATQISAKLGNTWIFSKGMSDVITNSTIEIINDSLGSSRRCGGQGDILSGILATILNWTSEKSSTELYNLPNFAAASLVSSHITRTVSAEAYKHMGMGFIASDMINLIPIIVRRLMKQ